MSSTLESKPTRAVELTEEEAHAVWESLTQEARWKSQALHELAQKFLPGHSDT